ncbi:tRNA 2-selenouridine(34) synthase MnmH [Paenibacillus flagellatus]|uniref:tRNA 2-selenouridine(34) synthase MnmH n=1 Tax=Paenibacillus flagellatus TaxID=2211139 RepID=A0A2V5KDS7_9BACL|nr:tRNA 2-selenouridine(34) synthase MnmH [Paenibacillus flagellatus]PYI56143.1 tRNA 2-selenouridine(34) synthase MnmH [Paenibacillus flagellatus]
MFQDIDVGKLLELQKQGELALVDVRSPQEFEESTVPGSVNVPLFDDAERAEIGTLYKQVSVQAAKDRGLEIVSAKLPDFVRSFAAIPGRKAVFCWRGGMRSRTTATLLSLMDIRVYRLAGGYRAFRRWVVETLEQFEFKPRAIVLNGNTGTGKTDILHRLAADGYPVLDLEGMAGHRGSIFGQIGMKPNNQKTFEALLALRLLELNDKPYVVMEGESRRIGKACLPPFLVEAKERGEQLLLELPLAERVRHIVERYEPHRHKAECIEAFGRIRRRIHTPIAAEIGRAMHEDRFADACALLLESYYDPRYEHAVSSYADGNVTVVRAETVDEAYRLVKERLEAPAEAGAGVK